MNWSDEVSRTECGELTDLADTAGICTSGF